jgi:hypothetical protein
VHKFKKLSIQYEAPPYKTESIELRIEICSGGSEIAQEYYLPVEDFGNYTFQVVNVGNAAIKMRYEAWTSTVTMENRPLKERKLPGGYNTWLGKSCQSIMATKNQQHSSNDNSNYYQLFNRTDNIRHILG